MLHSTLVYCDSPLKYFCERFVQNIEDPPEKWQRRLDVIQTLLAFCNSQGITWTDAFTRCACAFFLEEILIQIRVNFNVTNYKKQRRIWKEKRTENEKG